MCSQSTNVTDRRTDRRTDKRHAIARPRLHCSASRGKKTLVHERTYRSKGYHISACKGGSGDLSTLIFCHTYPFCPSNFQPSLRAITSKIFENTENAHDQLWLKMPLTNFTPGVEGVYSSQ